MSIEIAPRLPWPMLASVFTACLLSANLPGSAASLPKLKVSENQMQHAKNLLFSRPFLTRVPDDTVIVTDRVPTSVPGAGRYRFAATRDSGGAYAMVYAPVSRKFGVRMNAIQGSPVKAWWFNPRTGAAAAIGEFANTGTREFTPPDPGEALDWVLVLDEATRHFPPPGTLPRP